ncbi:isochorismatase family protein [Pseudomonas sp. 008]|uniref:isochorismatase family protein n=1 Tax=Pseudomonas sp. 008 TaxID=2803906 RepID=UPI00194DC0A2|nr:isochorismatase family protein [Pseudomonas sp. 008]GID03273.1 isochorismatase [Pseudomonas sp. 008]
MKIDRAKAALLVIDMQPKVLQLISAHEETLQRCKWLVDLFEDLKVPVQFSAHYPKGLGPVSQELLDCAGTPNVISKSYFSCVEDEGVFTEKYGSHEQWVICGIETHACVMLTALDLVAAGKQVFLVVDAVESRSETDKIVALQRMESAGVHMITREMALFELLRCAGTEEFKMCSKKYLM